MTFRPWKLALLAASLGLVAAGCRGMLDIPERAKARGYNPQEEHHDGPLFRSMTGQPVSSVPEGAAAANQPPPGASASRPLSGGVEPASGAEPISPDGEPMPQADPNSTMVLPRAGPEPKPDDDGFQLSGLAPWNWGKHLKGLFVPPPNEGMARAFYREGQELYREGHYPAAWKRFRKAARRWPDSPLEEDALFMQAESQFFADRYPKASDTYERLLKKYGYTKHLDTAVSRQFAIGRYWEQLDATSPAWLLGFQFFDSSRPWFDTWGYALKAYQTVPMYDPTGPLADDSIMAAANAYFLKERYEEAAFQYDVLRKNYPKSEFQLPAHMLGMKAREMSYEGPLYDGKSLDQADEIAQQTMLLFGDQLGEDRRQVIGFQNRITEEKALRDWTVGRYYDRRHAYGAARYYYRSVLENYPGTQVAVQTRARLEEIGGLPDNPPERFVWLTQWFETERR